MSHRWILVVEDDPQDLSLIDRMLRKSLRKERAQLCMCGQEALAVMDRCETGPALVLLDWRLPGLPSIEVLKRMRADERMKFTPVVFFSGDQREESMREALEAGANSYVCKSIEYERMTDDLQTAFHYWLDIHCSPSPQN